jgi:hypothetical protein
MKAKVCLSSTNCVLLVECLYLVEDVVAPGQGPGAKFLETVEVVMTH